MPDLEEIIRSLRGAFMACLGNKQGLSLFEQSFEAFWRSFFAMAVAAPLFLLYLAAERELRLAAMAAEADQLASAPAYYLINGIFYVIGWIIFPVLMIFVCRLLNLTQNYGLYITVYNWSSVIILAAHAPPYILLGFDILGEGVAVLIGVVAFGFSVCARYFVTTLALGVRSATAVAIVAAEFALSFFMADLTRSLTG